MSEKSYRKPLALALGATFAAAMSAAPMASADSNPFGMQDLGSGYMQLAEGKCGEGKCGANKAQKEGMPMKMEGKCGGKSTEEGMPMKMEGKCGGKPMKKEGKCGAGKATEEGKCGGKG